MNNIGCLTVNRVKRAIGTQPCTAIIAELYVVGTGATGIGVAIIAGAGLTGVGST